MIGCELKDRNLLYLDTKWNLHGTLRLGAFLSLLRYVRRERIKIIYVCGLRAFMAALLSWLMPKVKLVHVSAEPEF